MSAEYPEHKVHVSHDFAVPAEALWSVVGDFTDLSWVPEVPRSEFEGEGPGMVRRMYLDETFAIVERLDAIDPANRTISYSIAENNPLPCSDYAATMEVIETGPGTCRLEWGCTFEPLGVTEDEAIANVTGFYHSLIPGIEKSVGLTP